MCVFTCWLITSSLCSLRCVRSHSVAWDDGSIRKGQATLWATSNDKIVRFSVSWFRIILFWDKVKSSATEAKELLSFCALCVVQSCLTAVMLIDQCLSYARQRNEVPHLPFILCSSISCSLAQGFSVSDLFICVFHTSFITLRTDTSNPGAFLVSFVFACVMYHLSIRPKKSHSDTCVIMCSCFWLLHKHYL